MSILSLFKKSKDEDDVPEVKVTKRIAKDRHLVRVVNLRNEFEVLSGELVDMELNVSMIRSEKEKHSDKIIRRMALIKYEIDIREGLLKWLC